MAYKVNYPHLGEGGNLEAFNVSEWPNGRIQLGYVYENGPNLWQFVKIVDAANAAVGDVLYWKSKAARTVTPTIGNSSAGEVAGVATAIAGAANNFVVVKQRGLFDVKANGLFARGTEVMSDSANNRVVPAGTRARVALADSDAAAGVLSWLNPYTHALRIVRLSIDRTTASTAAGTADFGVAATAILNDTLLDGLDMNAAAAMTDNIITPGTNGLAAVNLAAGSYVTGSKASGAMAGLVGFAYIDFIHRAAINPQAIGIAQGAISAGKVSVALDLVPA